MKGILGINIAIGFWLVIAAFTMHGEYNSGIQMGMTALSGFALLICAIWFAGDEDMARAASIAYVFVGAWLVGSPFVFGFHPRNDMFCGIAVIVTGLLLVSQTALRRTHA